MRGDERNGKVDLICLKGEHDCIAFAIFQVMIPCTYTSQYKYVLYAKDGEEK